MFYSQSIFIMQRYTFPQQMQTKATKTQQKQEKPATGWAGGNGQKPEQGLP
jgi:hypothetical protein